VNLKVVSETTICRYFTVIFPVFSKMHRDFADFLPWFSYSPSYAVIVARPSHAGIVSKRLDGSGWFFGNGQQ